MGAVIKYPFLWHWEFLNDSHSSWHKTATSSQQRCVTLGSTYRDSRLTKSTSESVFTMSKAFWIAATWWSSTWLTDSSVWGYSNASSCMCLTISSEKAVEFMALLCKFLAAGVKIFVAPLTTPRHFLIARVTRAAILGVGWVRTGVCGFLLLRNIVQPKNGPSPYAD